MPDTLFSRSYLDDGLKETEEYRQINPQRMAATSVKNWSVHYKRILAPVTAPSGNEAPGRGCSSYGRS